MPVTAFIFPDEELCLRLCLDGIQATRLGSAVTYPPGLVIIIFEVGEVDKIDAAEEEAEEEIIDIDLLPVIYLYII